MNAQTLAIGVISLIGIVVLAVMLAGRHTTGSAQAIDDRQYARNARMLANLKHEGLWEKPIIDNR